MKQFMLGFFVTLIGITVLWGLERAWQKDVAAVSEAEVIDSMYYCHADCIECKQSGRKQVNILNRKGQIIAIYYDTVIKTDTQFPNHSNISGNAEETKVSLSNRD